MRILLTGASGQLGRAFLETAKGHDVTPIVHRPEGESRPGDAPGFPFTGPGGPVVADLANPRPLAEFIVDSHPDWVVHAAAMTNVDACEKEPEKARLVNGVATGLLAQACAEVGASMAYVSTDYVFDGAKGHYREEDAPNPVQEYGRSKLEGERRARGVFPDVLIARASVVFGPNKKNFVTWLLEELRAGRKVRIVSDQVVSPTWTYDLSEQLLALMEADAGGTFHTAGATRLSRLDMARQVASVFGLDAGLIEPVTTAQMTWAARRPRDSSLDVSKVSKYKVPLPFENALAALRDVSRGR